MKENLPRTSFASPAADTSPARASGWSFTWYLSASSLWVAGMSLQGFLFTWLLVGVLKQTADMAGIGRMLSEIPPLAILLLGGILGDRCNGRTFLIWMHALMTLPPLLIATVYGFDRLSYWWVVLFGVLMASIQALSDPSRQAALSRVADMNIQRAVTLMMVVTSLVGTGGFMIGARLESWGLTTLLVIQAMLFFAGIFAIRRLPDLLQPPVHKPRLTEGIRVIWQFPLIRNLIGLSFLSSLFNAGAYVIAIPYIAKEVYGGDAAFFAQVMIIFTLGSIGSNVILLFFMPLKLPGRLFLVMQLTRILILVLLWLQPGVGLFFLTLFAWGINMGVTSTLVRSIIQELAPAVTRSQILAFLQLTFMVSSPISALLLGLFIAGVNPMAALIPGMLISLLIFGLGILFSGLWQYQSGSQSTSD